MHPSSLRRLLSTTAVLCALPLLGGCFAYDTTVRLSPDGSGTVEQELVLTGGMAEMMRFARATDDEGADLCAEQHLGAGVRLVSAEPIEEAERVGCRQVYAFADINTLRLKPDLDGSLPGGLGAGEEALQAGGDPITFTFHPGSPATLVVRMPEQGSGEPAEAAGEVRAEGKQTEDPVGRAMALAMMREMLRGSRFSVHLEVPGEIVETDATHRDGGRITLIEMDFDALLGDAESLERLMDLERTSPEKAKTLLAQTPGMKVETRDEVTIRFR
jgi:hypothetical protein